jgi:DNA-binding MarR family transcriptional regulator
MGRQQSVEDQAEASLWQLMSSVTNRFGREALRGLTGCKLGMQGARVLTCLLEKEPLCCSDLANAVGLEATALSHLLRSLAAQDLIQRARTASDQRSIEVRLTSWGRDVAEQCRSVNARTASLLVDGLDQKDVQTLHSILTRMNANLETAPAPQA